MQKVYTPKKKDNLRGSVDAYLTNGRYDPKKSQMRAEELRIKRADFEERRRKSFQTYGQFPSAVVFENMVALVKHKVRYRKEDSLQLVEQ